MLLPKRRLMDFFAEESHTCEASLALTIGLDGDKIAYMIGRRTAALQLYEFIGKNTKRDEIESEAVLAFARSEFKKASDIAYSENISADFPRDKQLAFGKIRVYKSAITNTEALIKELTPKEEDEGAQ